MSACPYARKKSRDSAISRGRRRYGNCSLSTLSRIPALSDHVIPLRQHRRTNTADQSSLNALLPPPPRAGSIMQFIPAAGGMIQPISMIQSETETRDRRRRDEEINRPFQSRSVIFEAIILAVNRIARVMGRIINLIVSIITTKGISH